MNVSRSLVVPAALVLALATSVSGGCTGKSLHGDAGGAVDAGALDGPPCVVAGSSYGFGQSVPELQQTPCDVCVCGDGGVTCTGQRCPGGICTIGIDHTCNDDSTVAASRGKCLSDGTCDCGSYPKSPLTGRCRAPGHTGGYQCEYAGTLFNDDITCTDGCSSCACQNDGVEMVPSTSCPSGSFCGVDQVYTFGDTMSVFSARIAGHTTLSPATTSGGPQATYVYTRDGRPGMPSVSCAPPLPACGDPNTPVDLRIVMGYISDPDVQEILNFADRTQQSLTLGSPPYDFSIQRGAGPRIVVGYGCDGSILNCSFVPRSLQDLVQWVHWMNLVQLKSPACDVLAGPTFPCGTTTCQSGTEYCAWDEWGTEACRPYPPGCDRCDCATADALPLLQQGNPRCGVTFLLQCNDGTQTRMPGEASPTLTVTCVFTD